MVNTSWIKNLKTPIAVIGLGKSGTSALQLLKTVGFSTKELLSFDDKNTSADISKPEDLLSKKPQTLVVSPGVPLNLPWIQTLAQQGCFITSEISLAASVITSEKIIGVTGSVGKSTVVSLLGSALVKEDPHHFVGGNLGTPFCEYALRLLNGGSIASWIVLELSSYQLENCHGLNLNFSAITFLSENHLERYESLNHYYAAKLSITARTKNVCIFNLSSPDCVTFSKQSKRESILVNAKTDLSEAEINKICLIGSHNHDNFAVAIRLAKLANWSEASIKKMYFFTGLPHRLESIGIFNGVQFVNDSKATAMDAVSVASAGCLKKLAPSARLFLMLGGKDKNLPWQQLAVLKSKSQINFIFFGDCGSLVKRILNDNGPVFINLKSAVDHCLKAAQSGDFVLLSPGGTSLDEFKNFEQRGDFFKAAVLNYFNHSSLK